MSTTSTVHNDPLARYAVYALMALALWAGVRSLERAPDPVQAQGPIIFATPALPTGIPADPPAPAIMLIAPTPIPLPEGATAAAPAPSSPPLVQNDAAPENAAQIDAGEAAPPILQATEESPAIDAALNDPNLNGGNVAPEGCPFPIINGVCANGVLAKSIPDPAFGEKSSADASNDPAHVKARSR